MSLFELATKDFISALPPLVKSKILSELLSSNSENELNQIQAKLWPNGRPTIRTYDYVLFLSKGRLGRLDQISEEKSMKYMNISTVKLELMLIYYG